MPACKILRYFDEEVMVVSILSLLCNVSEDLYGEVNERYLYNVRRVRVIAEIWTAKEDRRLLMESTSADRSPPMRSASSSGSCGVFV